MEEDEGRKRRGVKVRGSWGDAECIFMSSCLSSFWVVWSHRHKFLAPPPPLSFISPSIFPPVFQKVLCSNPPQSSLIMFANFPPQFPPSFPPPDVPRYLSILLPFSSSSLFVYCKLTQQFSVWLFSPSSLPPPPPPQHHHTHPL